MAIHSQMADAELHVPGYIQTSDPGAVGEGILWLDTSGGADNWILKVRNSADDGWEIPAGGGVTGIPVGETVDAHWDIIANLQFGVVLTPAQAAFSDVVLDTGDGSTDYFDDVVSGNSVLVIPGTVAISVLLANDETAVITDDGEGILEDAVNNVSGTVGYGNGEWTLTFAGSIPKNLEDITMDGEYWSGSLMARITAKDLVTTVRGGFPPFQYAVIAEGGGPPGVTYPDPLDAYYEFSCGDAEGTVPLEVWVYDAFGNAQFATVFVNAYDAFGTC